MRILLLALMIALLPVRGWMGNAMAVDMASQAVAKAQQTDSEADADASMPADCPMHAQSAGKEAADGDAQVTGSVHCNGCDNCELCLALVTSTWPEELTPTITRHAAPLATGYRFSSADRFSSFKPPIS
jgi:hypothetical protein